MVPRSSRPPPEPSRSTSTRRRSAPASRSLPPLPPAGQPAPGGRRRRGGLDGRRRPSTPVHRCSSRTTAAPPGASPDAVFRRPAQWRPAEADLRAAPVNAARRPALRLAWSPRSARHPRPSCPRSRPSIWSRAQGIWNSPRATTTADPPTCTRSIRPGQPSTRANSVEGRPTRRPADLDLARRTRSGRAAPGGPRAGPRRAGRRILVDALAGKKHAGLPAAPRPRSNWPQLEHARARRCPAARRHRLLAPSST